MVVLIKPLSCRRVLHSSCVRSGRAEGIAVPKQSSATGYAIVLVYVARLSPRSDTEHSAGESVSTVDEALLRSTLVDSEIDWARCRVTRRDDRVLVLVPPGEPAANLADVLPYRLAAAVDGIGIVIHVGESIGDSSAVESASRIVDSVKKDPRRSTSGLDVFVTDRAYREIILGGAAVERDAYVRANLSMDGSVGDVWMRDADISAAAWSWLDKVSVEHPDAFRILRCCAFLGPGPAFLSWFAQDGRGPSGAGELAEILRAGIERGVLKVDLSSGSIQWHPSLNAVLRRRMTSEESAQARREAYLLLAELDPAAPASPGSWPRYRELLPHVGVPDLLTSGEAPVRALVVNLVRYLYFAGDQRGAAEFADRAWNAWGADGAQGREALALASSRGLIQWMLANYDTAADINERVLTARRGESEHARETIMARLGEALDLRRRGEFVEARSRNMAIHEDARGLFGDDDPTALQTAHDLAVVSRLCGDVRAALDLDTVTWQKRSAALGPDSSDTLNTRSGVYVDRRELGEYRAVLDEHEKVAERVAELTGDDAPGTLVRRAYLAVARRRAGHVAQALELSARTYPLLEQVYGLRHPATLACAVGYATDLRYAGRLDESNTLGELVRDEYRRLFPDRHPMIWAADANAAITARLRGDARRARELNEHALARLQAALGEDHPHAIACAVNLASDLAAAGDLEDAVRVGTDACNRAERNERALGATHPATLAARANLALDLRAQGADNEQDHRKILDALREALGEEHRVFADAAARTRTNFDIDPLPL